MADRVVPAGPGTEVLLRDPARTRTLDRDVDGNRTRRSFRRTLVLFVAVAAVALAGTGANADVAAVRRGACSGPSRWRLVVAPDAGILRVRLSVRGGRADQRWNIFMDHNGTGFFAGSRISGADGLWIVRRRVANLAGLDTIRFGAYNVPTGETCRGRVSV